MCLCPYPMALPLRVRSCAKPICVSSLAVSIRALLNILRMAPMDEVVDGRIELVGPDFDDIPDKGHMDLGIVVHVAGREMQDDFEPVSGAPDSLFHQWRLRHSAYRPAGYRLATRSPMAAELRRASHWRISARSLHARLRSDFGAIVDKVQVTIYTEPEAIGRATGRGTSGL